MEETLQNQILGKKFLEDERIQIHHEEQEMVDKLREELRIEEEKSKIVLILAQFFRFYIITDVNISAGFLLFWLDGLYYIFSYTIIPRTIKEQNFIFSSKSVPLYV